MFMNFRKIFAFPHFSGQSLGASWGCPRLGRGELLRFAKHLGFQGTSKDWDKDSTILFIKKRYEK
jgi:hypothetical protein